MNTYGEAMEHRPPWRDRFWRALGYRYQMHDLPTDVHDELPGWAMTHIDLQFSMSDRLRLLLTGRVRLDVRQATKPVVDEVESATSVRIYAPGEAH